MCPNIFGFKAQLSPKKASKKTYPTSLINHPPYCFISSIFSFFHLVSAYLLFLADDL